MKLTRIIIFSLLAILCAGQSFSAEIVTNPKFIALDDNGNPLTGGCLYTYDCGTTSKTATCADNTCGSNNTNPIELDSRGEADIYVNQCFKFALYEADTDGVCDSTPSTTLVWTKDNIYQNITTRDTDVRDDQGINGLTALQALAATDGDSIWLNYRSSENDGGYGRFIFDSSDLSTEVAADEITAGQGDGGIYISLGSDKTGASGAWVRQFSGAVRPEWWGGDPTGVSDSAAAFTLAFANYNVVDATTAEGTWLIKSAVPVLSESTMLGYGSTFKGHTDLAAGWMFTTDAKQRVRFKGGTWQLYGAKGAFDFGPGSYDIYLDDLRINDSDTQTASTVYVRLRNGFHLHGKNVVMAGGSGTATYFQAIANSALSGFTVVNNISWIDSSFDAPYGATTIFDYDNTSGIGMNNLTHLNNTVQGGGKQYSFTNGASNMANISIRDNHSEDDSLADITGVYANTTGGRIDINIDGYSFANIDRPFDLNTSSTGVGYLTMKSGSLSTTSGSTAVFYNNDFNVIVLDQHRVNSYTWTITSGSGPVQHEYFYPVPFTTAKTILSGWSGFNLTNEGTSADVTHTLPDTPFDGCMVTLTNMADGYNLAAQAGGTNTIKYNGYIVPFVQSSTIGETVTVRFDTDTWYIVNNVGYDRDMEDVWQTALYDFDVHGGAQGIINIGSIPNNATITDAYYEVITPFTSGGLATVQWGVSGNDVNGLLADTAFDNAAYAEGYHDFIPGGTATNFTTKSTAAKQIGPTITTADLTAGKVRIWYKFSVSE